MQEEIKVAISEALKETMEEMKCFSTGNSNFQHFNIRKITNGFLAGDQSGDEIFFETEDAAKKHIIEKLKA